MFLKMETICGRFKYFEGLKQIRFKCVGQKKDLNVLFYFIFINEQSILIHVKIFNHENITTQKLRILGAI